MQLFGMQETVQLAGIEQIKLAGQAGAKLINLWPLTDPVQLDNDVKYAENLQVRITREMAELMTSNTVTIADAEFVYEGASEIPGRPQAVVDALLAANDAYDTVSGYAHSHDFQQFVEASRCFGLYWDGQTLDQAEQVVASTWQATVPQVGKIEASADPQVVAQRLAVSVQSAQSLAKVLGVNVGNQQGILPVLLYINELHEWLEIPRCCLNVREAYELIEFLQEEDCENSWARLIGSSAEKEWERHREDVLWDPDEAHKKAKEEDERKSREALKAKFAHIPEDPNKPPVEL